MNENKKEYICWFGGKVQDNYEIECYINENPDVIYSFNNGLFIDPEGSICLKVYAKNKKEAKNIALVLIKEKLNDVIKKLDRENKEEIYYVQTEIDNPNSLWASIEEFDEFDDKANPRVYIDEGNLYTYILASSYEDATKRAAALFSGFYEQQSKVLKEKYGK